MFRFGVIGTGAIATQFVKEAKENKDVEIIAVVARDIEKTKQFATQWNIEKTFDDIDEMLLDKKIDCVYIGSLHPTHPLFAIKSLKAGKHVLCEKPAALIPEQMSLICKTAKENNKLFMEAMTVGFNPLYIEIKTLINQGIIGEVTHVQSSFGKISKKAHKHSPELAGGAIYDIGIYNLFLVVDLLGPIENIQALSNKHHEWDVVGTVQLLAKHENGTQSYSYMTMDSLPVNEAIIIGTKGSIRILESWTTATGYELLLDGKLAKVIKKPELIGWLCYELASFVETLKKGNTENKTMTFDMSLQVQKEIAKLYKLLNLTLPEESILI